MFVVSLWGIISTIHQILSSTYTEPIDRGFWSILFFTLSYTTECIMYAMSTALFLHVTSDNLSIAGNGHEAGHVPGHLITLHLYLMFLLLVQVCFISVIHIN